MTRDEVLALPAGREMDALVAEKVMGWKPMGLNRSGEFWWDGQGGQFCTRPGGHPCCSTFHPSTDIAAAWAVVEKLDSGGPGLSLAVGAGWCDLYHERTQIDGFQGPAPLAICRAALVAVLGLTYLGASTIPAGAK